MAELKTQRTTASVADFLDAIVDPRQQAEARVLARLIRKATGKAPAMWGRGIVGYGAMTYTGSNGKEVDWFPVGFSPRKAALTVYLTGGVSKHTDLLKRLGTHKVGGGCLYLPKLDQVDQDVLGRLIARAMPRTAGPAAGARRRSPVKRAKSEK